jgi:cbb3-type cytochrome oxidase subunit 3
MTLSAAFGLLFLLVAIGVVLWLYRSRSEKD